MENEQRDYGTGSITPARNHAGEIRPGFYRVRFSYTDPQTGERGRDSATVKGKRNAQRKLDEFKEAHANGLDTNGGDTTFREFAAEWQAEREAAGEVREQQLKASASKAKILCETLGNRRLKDVSPANVQRTMAHIRETRKGKGGKPLSNSTLHEYFIVLNAILQAAYSLDYIRKNPCKQVKPPKKETAERRYLDKTQAAKLAEKLREQQSEKLEGYRAKEERQRAWGHANDRSGVLGITDQSYLLAARLALMTGARRGEVLAFTWADLCENGQCLHVAHSLDSKGKPQPPKTKESDRYIWLDPDTAQALAEWKQFQTEEGRKMGAVAEWAQISESTPICCNNVFGYIIPRNFARWWGAWTESNEFKTLKFHELRHTHATLLLSEGVDVKTVSARLGHATPEITLKVYAHAIPDKDRGAAQKMARIIADSLPISA